MRSAVADTGVLKVRFIQARFTLPEYDGIVYCERVLNCHRLPAVLQAPPLLQGPNLKEYPCAG
mgnify:CR=1 FL=1